MADILLSEIIEEEEFTGEESFLVDTPEGTRRSTYDQLKKKMNDDLGAGFSNADEFVECLTSYYSNREGFTYEQSHTAMDNNFDKDLMRIDCSTFIGLCLMGNDYESSPYVSDEALEPRKGWGIDLKGKKIRNAASICEFLTNMGYRIPFTETDNYTAEDAANDGLRDGDILFFSRLGGGESKGRYLDITHVAAIWNISHQYPLIEVTEAGEIPYPVKRGSWAVRGQQIVAVCRPKYNVTNVGESERAGILNDNLISLTQDVVARLADEAISGPISELKADLNNKVGWAKVTGSTLYLYADKEMTTLIQTVTLPSGGSGGGSADGNTTYTFAISGNVITVTDSDGGKQTITLPSAVTDSHINSLIDAKLGVIENGTY